MDYKAKYLKYKKKYLDLKLIGGTPPRPVRPVETPWAPMATAESRKKQQEAIQREMEEGIRKSLLTDIANNLIVDFNGEQIFPRRMSHNQIEITDVIYDWISDNIDLPDDLRDPITLQILEKPLKPVSASPQVFSKYTLNKLFAQNPSVHPFTREPLQFISVENDGIVTSEMGYSVPELETAIDNWWTIALNQYNIAHS